MRFILVRHGETDWNRQHRIQGQSDIPLNAHGEMQADRIAAALQHEAVDAIYASPLLRTMRTAQAIERFHGVSIQPLDGLKELDTGQLDGLHIPEIKSKYPQFYQVWAHDAASARLPGGESLPELQCRVWACIEDIRQHASGQNVLAVTHFFVILSLLCRILNLSLSNLRRFGMAVGSISVVELAGDRSKLVSFNETCHLR